MKQRITKKALSVYVGTKLSTDKKWAYKALVKIYDNQTEEEKKYGRSFEHNGIGFTKEDSFILSSMVEQYKERKFLTPKQMNVVFSRIKKYHKQIIKISDVEKLRLCYVSDPVNIQTELF